MGEVTGLLVNEMSRMNDNPFFSKAQNRGHDHRDKTGLSPAVRQNPGLLNPHYPVPKPTTEKGTAWSQDIPSLGLFDDVSVSYPPTRVQFSKSRKKNPSRENKHSKQLSHSVTYLDYIITMKSRLSY